MKTATSVNLYLDLTEVKQFPSWFRGDDPRIIPVRVGGFTKDFDVIEEKVDPEVISRWRSTMAGLIKKKHGENVDLAGADEMPIGFDFRGMPDGAAIRIKRGEVAK